MIPVDWHNFDPDAPNRGPYWDRGLLEDLFSGAVWRVPGAPEFEHYEGPAFDADEVSGVVVIPGRQNASRVESINWWINAAHRWALVIITGDEADEFPWRALEHPNMRVWKMGGKVSAMDGCDQPLGSGYPPWFRAFMPREAPDKHGWFFSGQINHQRRVECAQALEEAARHGSSGNLSLTEGFTQGLAPEKYARLLADSKIAPCPAGIQTPDTFRLYEALEAGCIPIADAPPPDGCDYWQFMFPDAPFPKVEQWNEVHDLIPELLAGWPDNANRISAWWMQTKRDLAYKLHRTIRDLRAPAGVIEIDHAIDASALKREWEGRPVHETAPADQVTAIIPTSPSPIHPSIEHIAATVDSVRASLGDCEIVIAIDGVRPEMAHRADTYAEYVRRLLWVCNHQWHNVVPVMLDEWGHQANAARRALELVRTPLVLFVEHDTPLVGEIDWPGLCSVVGDGTANMIRLHHEASILAPHRHLMVGERRAVRGVPLWGTVQWSQRPHLARADWYRRMLDVYFGTQSRTMIEDVMHGVLQHAWNVAGHVGWEQWRTWIYVPDGDVKRSEHLDSRGDDEKFDMMFRYEGDVPEGAPQPN